MIELDNTMLLFIGSENYSGKENRWPVTGPVGSNPSPATKTSTDHYYEWGILRYIDPYLNIMKPAKTRVVANNVLIFVRNHMMERNRFYNRASPYLVNLLVLLASSAFNLT